MSSSRWTRVFLRTCYLPPAAWGLFAGALAALAFNLLIVARFGGTEGKSEETLWLLFALFIGSAAFFGYLSAALEECRRAGDLDAFKLTVESPDKRKELLLAMLAGAATLAVAVVILLLM